MTQTPSRIAPRWKAIFDELQVELASMAYGSDFHTIGQLCQRFDVSQITAIRVLNELAALNLIEKIPGRGSVVRRINRPMLFRSIFPADTNKNLFSFDSASSRRMDGIFATTRRLGIDHGVMSEAHLASLFPRQASEPLFGFLLMGSVSRTTRKFLTTHQIPFVQVDPFASDTRLPHACVDRRQAGYVAAKHLLELGHRRIAWITGPVSMRNFRQRLAGYRDALREHGLSFDWSLVKEVDSLGLVEDPLRLIPATLVRQRLDELMHLHRPPTAIIAGDDNRAIHILTACRELGIEVPAQLSVLGYPNNPESSLTQPALSVVDACFEEVGQAAVQMLVDLVLSKANSSGAASNPTAKVIAPVLVHRQSTGPVPVKPRKKTEDSHELAGS